MTAVRRIARPLLAAVFVDQGVDQFRHPAKQVEAARPVVSTLAGPLRLPDDPELLIRANGAAMATAGTLLAFGRLPRVAATVLALSTVPTTYAAHPFWSESDPEKRRQTKLHFLKNLGLLGGVLLASVDTEGRPGLAWRSQRAAKDAKRAARLAKRDARRTTRQARRETGHAARRAGHSVHLG